MADPTVPDPESKVSRQGRAFVIAKLADCKTKRELEFAWDDLGVDAATDRAILAFRAFMIERLKKDRTKQQNKLMWVWCEQASNVLGGTKEDQQAWAKLTIGVPILRGEDENFREKYDRIIRPLPYDEKIEIMRDFDFPVTSLMKAAQMIRFMDTLHLRFTEQGIRLVEPEPDLAKYMGRYRANS